VLIATQTLLRFYITGKLLKVENVKTAFTKSKEVAEELSRGFVRNRYLVLRFEELYMWCAVA
jgi:predicted transcriptional regulator